MFSTSETEKETTQERFLALMRTADETIANKEREAHEAQAAEKRAREREAIELFRSDFDGALDPLVASACALRYEPTYGSARAALTVDGETWTIETYSHNRTETTFAFHGPDQQSSGIALKGEFQTYLLSAIARRRQAKEAAAAADAAANTAATVTSAAFPRTLLTERGHRIVALSLVSHYGFLQMKTADLDRDGSVLLTAIDSNSSHDHSSDDDFIRASSTRIALTPAEMTALVTAAESWRAELAAERAAAGTTGDDDDELPF